MAAGRSEVDDKDIKLIEKCPKDSLPKVSILYQNFLKELFLESFKKSVINTVFE